MELRSFEDVVALAEAKRDLKLKHALLEQVRLVHFKPGNIELNPLPQAAKDLTQELMRKLKAWTGRVWIVAVSDEPRRRAAWYPTSRSRSARDREDPRPPEGQGGAPAFPRRAHCRGRPTAAPESAEEPAEETDELREDGTSR